MIIRNEICILILFLTMTFIILSLRKIDENNMDSYDRSFLGNAGEGRVRGVTGTIYDKDGKIEVWLTLSDTNPFWGY